MFIAAFYILTSATMAFYLPSLRIKITLMIKKIFLTAIITVAAAGLYAQDQQVQKLKNEAKREIR